jgi:Tol biopolymer transport system component
VDLVQSETTIISPRFSPDGNRIAFYDLGTSSGLPISSRTVSLVIADLTIGGGPENGFTVFSLDQFDTDRRLIVDEVIPPLWAPDGRSVFVAHNSGIERLALSGERMDVVKGAKISAMILTKSGDRLIYSDRRNLYFLDRPSIVPRRALDEGFVPRFGNKTIGALALSPNEDRLAFAMGHELFVMDLSTRDVEEIFAAGNRIYWLAWVPNSERILFLSGREFGGGFGMSARMGDVEGKYRLYSVSPNGNEPLKLFSENRMDVRRATPALSPDGLVVSLTARGGPVKEIVLVATDGSGARMLTGGGPNSYASWRGGF